MELMKEFVNKSLKQNYCTNPKSNYTGNAEGFPRGIPEGFSFGEIHEKYPEEVPHKQENLRLDFLDEFHKHY